MSARNIWRYHLVGWLLFTASAAAFVISSAGTGDHVALAASLLFLLACIVFLIPLWAQRPRRNA